MLKYFIVFALLAQIISGIGGRGRSRSSSSGGSSSSSSSSTSYSSKQSYSSSKLYTTLSNSYYYNSYSGAYTSIALTPINNYGYFGTAITYNSNTSISNIVIIVPVVVILLTALLTCYIISKKLKAGCCDICCCIFCCQCSILKKKKYEEQDQQSYQMPQEKDSERKVNEYGVEEITDIEVKPKSRKRKAKNSDLVEQVTGVPNVSPMLAYPGGFPPQSMIMSPQTMMGYPPMMGPTPMMGPPPMIGPPPMMMAHPPKINMNQHHAVQQFGAQTASQSPRKQRPPK